MPTFGIRVGIKIGAPLDFSRYEGMEGDRFVLRSITDEIMYELMELSGQEYVDIYAQVAKDRIKAERAEAKAAASRKPDGSDKAADPPAAPRSDSRLAWCCARAPDRMAVGIETAVWRALAVFRALGLAYAVAVYVRRVDEYAHPLAGWVVLGLMAAWTVVASLLYAGRPAGPGRSSGSTWRSPAPRSWRRAGSTTSTGSRPAPRPCRSSGRRRRCWRSAIKGGWPAGVGAAAAVGAADLVHRGALTVSTANNIVLLLLAGAVVATRCPWPAAASSPWPGRWPCRRRPRSGSGCPARSTTGCCRCSRWSGAAAGRPAARRPSSAGWPPSRSRRCGPW